jgi:hypothetical protein
MWCDAQMKAVALALLKKEVKMGVVNHLVSEVDADDATMKMSKRLFLTICKLSL